MIGANEQERLRAAGISVGTAGPSGWTEFVAANGNPCASYDAESGVVVATCQVVHAPRARVVDGAENEDEAVDVFIDEADDAFEAQRLPAWTAAGWELVDVEDESADRSVIFVFATLERGCATPAEVCDAVLFAAAHEADVIDL